MGFQFIHIESYSRITPKVGKSGGHSVRSVIAEANRDQGNAPHVLATSPPLYIYGKPLAELEDICERWAASVTDAKGRKTRKDALCLVAGVFSVPQGTSPCRWERVKADALKWLQVRYGDRLQTVIEHRDEAHPHCHFYVVPRLGERFEVIHDGKRAANELPKNTHKGQRNQAYKVAMRSFQDAYYEFVGAPNGLARIGPRRRRLTRAQWKQEQAASGLVAHMLGVAKSQRESAEAEAVRTRERAYAALADAEAIKVSAENASAETLEQAAVAAKKAARKIMTQARTDGFDAGIESFTRSSLWGRLIELVHFNRHMRNTLEQQVVSLTAERDSAVADAQLTARLRAEAKKLKKRVSVLEAENESAYEEIKRLDREMTVLRSQELELINLQAAYGAQEASALLAQRQHERAYALSKEETSASYKRCAVERFNSLSI